MSKPSPVPRELDQGIAAAFRRQASDAPAPSPSVLARLQRHAERRLGVQLAVPDREGPDPLVRMPKDKDKDKDDAPPQTSRYQISGEIARGGVGIVYRGRDQDLGRDVALKVLRPEYVDHEGVLARFVEEAQIGGQLQHPGIVPVYELGLQQDQRPFFAMKLVKGETLAALLASRTTPREERRRFLAIFEQVCQTIAYAHARSVVHRDLKPANVMVGAFGEVQVVDWGFAKVLSRGGIADERRARRAPQESVISTARSASRSQSLAGSVFGTPAYMPPEQAEGDVEAMDERSDVFALGALLCEILTGAPPYPEGQAEALRRAAAGDVAPALERLRGSGADEELVELVTGCLQKEPAARPRSADVVAERIGAYLTSLEERLQQARVEAAEEKVRADAAHKAHRLTLALAASVLGALALGGGGWMWIEAQAAERRALVEGQVRADLREAQLLEVRAADVRTEAAWSEALAAAQQASSLLVSASHSPELRGEVERTVRRLEAERGAAARAAAQRTRDLAMRARLERIRLPDGDNPVRGLHAVPAGPRTYERRVRAYGQAFVVFGVDVENLPVHEAAARLRESTIVDELMLALDDWRWLLSRMVGHDQASGDRLGRLAAAADPDPWRQKCRKHIWTKPHDEAVHRELVEEAMKTDLPAASYLLLAEWSVGRTSGEIEGILKYGRLVHPDDFNLAFELGHHLLHTNPPDLQGARTALETAWSLRPESGVAATWLQEALGRDERFAEAEALARAWLRRDPDDAWWHFRLGWALVIRAETATDERAGLLAAAEQCYERAVELDPEFAYAWHDLGSLRFAQERWLECETSLRRAIQAGLSNAILFNTLAICEEQLGRKDDAIETFLRALEVDPECADAHSNLARLLMDLERHEEALEHARTAVRIDPEDARYRLNHNFVLSAVGDHEAALAEMDELLERDPEHIGAHRSRGLLLAKLGRAREAVESLRRVLAEQPDDWACWGGLASALEQTNVEEAEEAYRRALELAPEEPGLLYNWGTFLMGRRNAKAEEVLTEAARLRPEHARTWYNLGIVAYTQGSLTDAERCYRRALELEPAYPEGWCNLGHALSGQTRFREALAAFERGHELGTRRPGWKYPSSEWIEEARANLGREDTLRALIEDVEGAADTDTLASASDAAYWIRRYAAAARLAERVLAEDPARASDPHTEDRYRAIYMAALAGCGEGDDAAELDSQARRAWRAKALGWLRADLDAWRTIAAESNEGRTQAARMLRHSLSDPDLTGVRDDLTSLAAEERAEWEAVWQALEQTLEAIGGGEQR